jgi:hypothetical protein
MNRSRKSLSILSMGTTSLAIMLACAPAAQARGPHFAGSTVTRTGPYGNSSFRQSGISTNGQGGFNAGSTFTGPAGRTSTRAQSGGYNAATGTFTRSGGTTLPNGQQSHFNTSVQATGNGYTRSATHTGPNGNSVTSQGGATYNAANGQIDQSRTITGPEGHSATETRTIDIGQNN